MKRLLLLAIIICTISCSKKEGNLYYYTELNEEVIFSVLPDENSDTIYAKSDSLAYLDAYQKYFISKINKERPKYDMLPDVTGFRLFRADKRDITDSIKATISEEVITDIEKNVRETLSKEISEDEKSSTDKKSIRDNKQISKLKQYFTFKKDEFDPDGKSWATPKSAPYYTNRNALYCYFNLTDSTASNLRFRLQYVADDWLFIDKVQFLIDGKPYEYTPCEVKRDNADGDIWEWYDCGVGIMDWELINALSNAKSAKMKLIGHQYHDIRNITPKQILNIKRSVELYKAYGAETY
ncbi:hypothetical protein ACLI1A_10390 [Flavobacterium sp. RHBU_3]|uniref:hypothetical protein n=1 Tax=Flavobacterium sp. RHBU_3 TaxID=3391184 RepID=UPI003984E1BD